MVQETLALPAPTASYGEGPSWRSNAELIDALPCIDPLTTDVKRQVEQLIEEEMRSSSKRPADYLRELPALPPMKFEAHPMLNVEYERCAWLLALPARRSRGASRTMRRGALHAPRCAQQGAEGGVGCQLLAQGHCLPQSKCFQPLDCFPLPPMSRTHAAGCARGSPWRRWTCHAISWRRPGPHTLPTLPPGRQLWTMHRHS